jgi:cytoskeletal protein RodZ
VTQVNRPLLIALLATAVLAAGWMAFLRPGAVQSTTDEVTAPAKVATQARQAAAATDKASAATEAAAEKVADESSAATATPATPATTPKKAATPAPAAKAQKTEKKAESKSTADPQAAVLKEMDAGKVVVLLFWNPSGADDRAARETLKDLKLRDGKITVHAVDVKDVGRYDSVTQGVSVTQTPMTMVVEDGKARTIAGLVDPTELDQLVRLALVKK